MKFYLFALFLTTFIIGDRLWSQPLVVEPSRMLVASDSFETNDRPRIQISADGLRHVLWGARQGASAHIYHLQAAVGEEYPVQAQRVSAGTTRGYLTEAGAGPTLRVRGNYVAAGWDDENGNNRGMWVARSPDFGQTWETPIRVNPNGAGTRYYNAVEIFPDGRLCQMWLAFTSGLSNPHFRWTMQDSLGAFLPFIDASAPAPAEICNCCWPDQLILDNGTILTAFRNNESNLRDIYVTRSFDGGLTFTDAERIDYSGWVLPECPTTGPGLAADGATVLCTWMSVIEETPTIHAARSSDYGETWEPMVALEHIAGLAVRNYPQSALRGSVGVIAWQESNENLTMSIRASVSLDSGRTWSASFPVSDHASNPCVQVSMDIDPAGTIHFVWSELDDHGSHIRWTQANLPASGSGERIWIPERYLDAFPNPFNATTTIPFRITQDSYVSLTIYDVLGRNVATLVAEDRAAGDYRVSWNAEAQTSGIYLARLQTHRGASFEKLVLLK